MSESVASTEKANWRMSTYMSGPLSDMPEGTTPHAKLTNTCLPAGHASNKTPIFITGVIDARSFLAQLLSIFSWRTDGPI
jgi:hypothetical protein